MRKLSAIMITDIVGYVTLMGEDESKALDLLEKNRTLIKSAIEQFRGEWLKEMGDGTLSCFASAVTECNCAVVVQQNLMVHHDLKVRDRIDVGNVVLESGDAFGDGVNVASRIEPLAEPGGICVSGRVYSYIMDRPDIESVFLGEKELKHVKRPIKIYALKRVNLQVPAVDPSASAEA